ncbi:MAG TPA: NADH-quinone oxidoreductase subunit A [Thermoanaerobaculia bacterium]|nr:NADH-quinone oxidoreductase subunit A [Thermoanaerobaculia bacterium]
MGSPLAFLPILMMLVGAMGVGALLLGLNYLLGRKVKTKRKLSTYESGMPLLDDSHKRISVKFFIVAMIFILFDIEAAFLYPWAVVFREGGMAVFVEMLVFVVVLFLGFGYLWKKGAFDWN